MDGTDLETTAPYEGCGQVTRKRKLTDTHGKVREIEVTVYGRKVIVLIDAATKIPLAVKVVPIQEHEVLFLRALVMQARTKSGGLCSPVQGRVDRGVLAGTDVWGLDQHDITLVVSATEDVAVTRAPGSWPLPALGSRGGAPGAHGAAWTGHNRQD